MPTYMGQIVPPEVTTVNDPESAWPPHGLTLLDDEELELSEDELSELELSELELSDLLLPSSVFGGGISAGSSAIGAYSGADVRNTLAPSNGANAGV